MPFEAANTVSRDGGLNRWKDKDPETTRTKMFSFKLSPAEYDGITAKAQAANLSRAELILQAVAAFRPNNPNPARR